MSYPEIGVMLSYLGGNESSVAAFKSALNKEITALELKDEELLFTFSDGSKVKLFDDGQSCCEHRYMTTNDDLSYFVGSTLIDAEVADAPNIGDEYDNHEVQFLKVKTSSGIFTIESHNEHNGCYGGFSICAAVIVGSESG
jgi:hypothetical protein